MPGFEKSYIETIAPLIGIRECRRIVGEFVLTESHVRNATAFDDAVCRNLGEAAAVACAEAKTAGCDLKALDGRMLKQRLMRDGAIYAPVV